MRVLIAPDKFAGTLTAVEAADAIAEGWRRHAPDDELDLCPMADGGPGFVDVLHASLGGEVLAATVSDPYGMPVPATMLKVEETVYVESAQAIGRHLVGDRPVNTASSYGVGELISSAIDAGGTHVVVGLGGSGTNDAGAGLLQALGSMGDVMLDAGYRGISTMREFFPGPPVSADLVAATDVDNPLTGLFGATKVFGPQKGIAEDEIPVVDSILTEFAELVGWRTSLEPGAGAAGGVGFALLHLGASRVSGIALVADAVGLAGRARRADLVLTGEGAFDFSSRAGKVPYGVAEVAGDALRPCVALAGRVLVGSREMRALGIESAYSLLDLVGEQRAMADPAGALADLAQRTARTWSPRV